MPIINKPNSKPISERPKMSANLYVIEDYENKTVCRLKKTNPIKPNLKRAKMNVNLTLTKDYRKKDDFSVRINKPNFPNAKNERKRFFTKGL